MDSEWARCSPLSHTSASVARPRELQQPATAGAGPVVLPVRRTGSGTTSPRRRARRRSPRCPGGATGPGRRARAPWAGIHWRGSVPSAAGPAAAHGEVGAHAHSTPSSRSVSGPIAVGQGGHARVPVLLHGLEDAGQVDLAAAHHAGQGELQRLGPGGQLGEGRRRRLGAGAVLDGSASRRSRRPARRWRRTGGRSRRRRGGTCRDPASRSQARSSARAAGPAGPPGCRRAGGPGARRSGPRPAPPGRGRPGGRGPSRISSTYGGSADRSAWAPESEDAVEVVARRARSSRRCGSSPRRRSARSSIWGTMVVFTWAIR